MSTTAPHKRTQLIRILKMLEAGERLTQLRSTVELGCLRLGARVWDLRKEGHNIKKEMVEVPCAVTGGTARVAEYFIPKPGASTDARQPVPTA